MWRSLALALALAACASSAARRVPRLAALIGADEAAVTREFGPPTLSYDRGGLRTLVYDRRVVERPAGRFTATAATFPCRITFTLAEGRVRSFDQQGAGC